MVLLTTACRRDPPVEGTVIKPPGRVESSSPLPSTATADPAPAGDPDPYFGGPTERPLPDPEEADAISLITEEEVRSAREVRVPTPVDPWPAAIEEARRRALPCFAGQPPGDYEVVYDAHITPSGRASRLEPISATVADPRLLECVRAALEGPYPTELSGRRERIAVRVHG